MILLLLVVAVAEITVLAGHLVTFVTICGFIVHARVVNQRVVAVVVASVAAAAATVVAVVVVMLIQSICLQIHHILLVIIVVVLNARAAIAATAIVLACSRFLRWRQLGELCLVPQRHIQRLLLLLLLTSDNHSGRLHERRVAASR